ncbi:gamma-glutamyltranspeptidase [Meredithblackwellia eburnea MCA 4105]
MLSKTILFGSLALAGLTEASVLPIAVSDSGHEAFERRDGGLFVGKRAIVNGTTHGAVATEAAPCSQIGIDILEQGGNAADAIIASGLCVGTISAYHSGIGGGGFMLVRFNKEDGSGHAYEMIDFRETMPAAGNETMYLNATSKTASTIGGLAVGVPGELRGWEALHQRHGKLNWTSLFAGAIKLGREGFTVNVDLAAAIQQGASFIKSDPLWAEVYTHPNGSLLVQGDTCYRKRYADTLEKISWYGPDFFYTNETAINTAAAAYARGGILTTKDLANYTAIVREPVNITYRNSRIFSTVAPSSGAVVLSALKIFEGYQANYTDSDPEINVTTHRLIEANKFGYGQRANYGDPAFTPNVTELQKYYLTLPVVEDIRKKIVDNTTFNSLYYDPQNYAILNDSGTSHMAVIDGTGQAVSLTTTVNLYWGSQVMTTDGVILNDEMDDFSSPGQVNSFGFAASPANYIRGGKRPQSSIASSIAEDLNSGEILMATGSAGGSRIITATLQQLYHHLDQGLSANACAHHARWHDQLSGQTYFELPAPQLGLAGYNNATVAYLASLGYNTTYEDTTGSTSQILVRAQDGLLSAASDPRKAAGAGLVY